MARTLTATAADYGTVAVAEKESETVEEEAEAEAAKRCPKRNCGHLHYVSVCDYLVRRPWV